MTSRDDLRDRLDALDGGALVEFDDITIGHETADGEFVDLDGERHDPGEIELVADFTGDRHDPGRDDADGGGRVYNDRDAEGHSREDRR